MVDGHHRPEDYVRAVHDIAVTGQRPTQTLVAQRLERSTPTAVEMLGRLADKGYLHREGREFSLTPLGRSLVERASRRHRLAELVLSGVVGLSLGRAHEEADRWGQVISDEVESRLAAVFSEPGPCPYGTDASKTNPSRVEGAPVPLADLVPGNAARFERIADLTALDASSVAYLVGHGFVPGASLCVETRAPDRTLLVNVGLKPVALGPALSVHVLVRARSKPDLFVIG